MSKRKLAAQFFSACALVLLDKHALGAFDPPVQADPANTYTAAIGVNYGPTQTYSMNIGYDADYNLNPDVYWFQYTSDGKTAVTFDTIGSSFNTGSGGSILPSSNESEIAVYSSAGKMMAISKNVVDASGNPVSISQFKNEPEPPPAGKLPTDYYYSEELTQLSFKANASSDPRWDVNPNDTKTYTGWTAPDNPGNGQNYAPLNEYHTWSSSLSKYKLLNDGSVVLSNGSNGTPVTNPGWRYSDYLRTGPSSSWNQARVLPAGVYYVAVSAETVVYAGDTYAEDYLEAPIHYDATGTETNNGSLPIITSPLGTFQYYDSPQGTFSGTLQLNVTQSLAGTQYQWTTDSNANWSSSTNWAGPVPTVAGDTANFLGTITAARTITLDAPETVGHLLFDSSMTYTLAGTNTLTLNNGTSPGDIILNSGTHVISAPLAIADSSTIIGYASTGLSINGPLSIAAGQTLTKDGAGSLSISGAQTNGVGSAIYIGEGTATIGTDPGSNLALTSTAAVTFPANTGNGIRPIHLSSLTISVNGLTTGSVTFVGPGFGNSSNRTVLVTSALNITGTTTIGWSGKLDLGGNDAIVHSGNLAILTNQITSGFSPTATTTWQGSNGITSSSAAGDTSHLTALGVIQNSSNGNASGPALYTSFDGVSVSNSDVLAKYTYYGDANLDGKVDASDYSKIDSAFVTHSGTGWFNGDFNYNGVINGSDYTLIDNAFDTQGSTLSLSIATLPLASVTTEIAGDLRPVAVPEPASLSLFVLGVSGLMGRRRRWL